MNQGPYPDNPYEGGQPVNVPPRYGTPPPYGYPPQAPPPAAAKMTTAKWAAVAVAALLVVSCGGYLAWNSYQNRKAREIPLYPGIQLIPSSVYQPGAG